MEVFSIAFDGVGVYFIFIVFVVGVFFLVLVCVRF